MSDEIVIDFNSVKTKSRSRWKKQIKRSQKKFTKRMIKRQQKRQNVEQYRKTGGKERFTSKRADEQVLKKS